MSKKLTVTIQSFSYKRAIPEDTDGNGGGFVFDCRAIENPGRYEEFKHYTGKDPQIIDFFDDVPEMHEFLRHAFALVDLSVENYMERGFTNLMVNFGCTGGQHRSVYSAEKLSEHLSEKYDVIVILKHTELNT